jgi:hypothetical protein
MCKDWPHVEEAIEMVTWVLSLCMVDRLSMEKQPFKIIVLPGWIFPGFSPAISVLLYSQTLFTTVLETLECYLSTSTNYMHIVASGPE